jgi:hypothetical protein
MSRQGRLFEILSHEKKLLSMYSKCSYNRKSSIYLLSIIFFEAYCSLLFARSHAFVVFICMHLIMHKQLYSHRFIVFLTLNKCLSWKHKTSPPPNMQLVFFFIVVLIYTISFTWGQCLSILGKSLVYVNDVH